MNWASLINLATAATALLPQFPGEQLAVNSAQSVLALIEAYRNTPGGRILGATQTALREALNLHFSETQRTLAEASAKLSSTVTPDP